FGVGDAFDFVQHPAGLDRRDPVLDVALAGAHADFDRLLGDRLVREHADPQLAAALHVARDAAARCFDLACGDRAAGCRLQAELAEADEIARYAEAPVTALELFAEFGS